MLDMNIELYFLDVNDNRPDQNNTFSLHLFLVENPKTQGLLS